jgi:hypothetical protein
LAVYPSPAAPAAALRRPHNATSGTFVG